jgi:spermidine synthase
MKAAGKILVSRHSGFNRIVLTENFEGLRTLRFSDGGPSQSVVKVGDPEHLVLAYTKVLVQGFAFVENPKRILVLGLGGGTLPFLFHKIFQNAQVDVVEIDPEVLAVASEFCGFVENERLRVYVEDARDFIERHEGCYDVIVLDCFGAESIPQHLLTTEFLKEVHKSLAPGGIAVANVWGRTDNRLYERMLRTYRDEFEEVFVLDVPGAGTKVFVALTFHEGRTHAELLERMLAIPIRRSPLEAPLRFRNSDQETLQDGVCVLRD